MVLHEVATNSQNLSSKGLFAAKLRTDLDMSG